MLPFHSVFRFSEGKTLKIQRVRDTSQQAFFTPGRYAGSGKNTGLGTQSLCLLFFPCTYYALEAQNGKLLEKFLKIMEKKEGKPIFLWLSLLADPQAETGGGCRGGRSLPVHFTLAAAACFCYPALPGKCIKMSLFDESLDTIPIQT